MSGDYTLSALRGFFSILSKPTVKVLAGLILTLLLLVVIGAIWISGKGEGLFWGYLGLSVLVSLIAALVFCTVCFGIKEEKI